MAGTKLLSTLSVRVTDEMADQVAEIARQLQLRPADVARLALAHGLLSVAGPASINERAIQAEDEKPSR
jgi:hypothetical protein